MAGRMDAATNEDTMLRSRFRHRGVTATGCALALLLCVGAAAQEPAPATPAESPETAATPVPPPKISYVGGQLKIDATDSTLADILTKVAALTGVTIDIPPAANQERMAVVQLGPGPAREVLASLLSDSNVDYVIQASDTDPMKLQSVLVMARDKKGAKPNGTDEMASVARSPYARRGMPQQPQETQAPDSPQPESIVAESAPTQPDQSAPPPPAEPPPSRQPSVSEQPGMINGAKIAPQPVPSSLDSQNITQTLQQMYQQRMQINQQDHQASPQTMAPNPH